MDFELSENHRMVKGMAHDFAKKEIIPFSAKWDEEAIFPREVFSKLGELGVMGMTIPEKWGGASMDVVSLCVAVEELSRFDGSVGLTVEAHNCLCVGHINFSGTDKQKGKYLINLAHGKHLGAWALTEPGSGSDAAGMKTTAVRKGDRWILNGTKNFITQGSVADTYVIMAVTDKAKKTHGISAFIVEKGIKGFSVGKKENKLGLRASDTAQLILEDVEIPLENLLGKENEGFVDTLKILDKGRVVIGAMAVGLGRAALEDSIEYAKQREQFGQPIANFQAIQWMITDMATELDAARLLVFNAATKADRGEKINLEAAICKLFASEVAVRATSKGIQIHGGYGYTKDFSVERYFRDVKLCEIGEGTSEILKLVIARNILK